MPKYLVVRETVTAQPDKATRPGAGGGLEQDYKLPVRHVLTTGLFAFFGSAWLWLAAVLVAVILVSLPPDLARRALPLLLLPLPFGLVPAFRAARAEWAEFSRLVKHSRWLVEEQQNRDIDGDGWIGQPPRIVINGRPPKPDPATEYAREVREWVLSLDARGTAFRDHADLGREEYEKRRDRLIDAGWAEWKDPRNHYRGWRLTTGVAEIAESVG